MASQLYAQTLFLAISFAEFYTQSYSCTPLLPSNSLFLGNHFYSNTIFNVRRGIADPGPFASDPDPDYGDRIWLVTKIGKLIN
jgi:hypothetical protein